MKQPRFGPGPTTLLATNVQSLAMTYGRAISDDGTRVVYSAETATNTTQVFLADSRTGGSVRQITSLGARVTEVPLHPTISGDGSRIAFAARRTVSGSASNSDGGVELYVYDLPTASFSKITNGPSSATADVVSSLNDDGSIVAFNYPRILSGAVTTSGTENNSEIYALAPPARPPSGALTAILNDASFGHEPLATKAVAPNSIALAQGTNLANTTTQSQRLADGTFPTGVAGTRVTVNGRAAQIFFVSPTQVHFLVPAQTEIGADEVIVTNSENFPARLNVTTLRAAPGIFTKNGDGIGEGLILNADTLQEGPFDPTSGNLRLTIFATGARNASQTTVSIGGRIVSAEGVLASTGMPGLDEVHVRVPSDLRGAGVVTLSIISDGRESNPVAVGFTGDPSRAILINEVLADPPDSAAGDANHDGVRDGTQDEFVELVNGNAGDTIGVSGWTIKTRATGSTTETTRFTFPSGTSVAAGEALVIFGGGTFNPNDPVFGCAQIFKAASASSGLSLTNTGLTILVRDSAGNLITQVAYGGSTGLDGNSSQSLTRSPDITGSFAMHSTPAAANGRRFSPGLILDGTPFGNCPGHLTSVTISPSSNSIAAGQNTQFMARAIDEYDRTMTGVTINFASDNTTVATVDATSTNPSTGVATANVTGRNQGTAHIQATVTSGGLTLNSSATLNVIPKVSRIDVAPATATINRGSTQGFTASAFDQNNQPLSGVTFTWNSSNPNIATVDSAGLARGVGIGGITITASAPDGSGGTASGTATLNVSVPLVINEINADVAPDSPSTTAIEGDANRDGVRDSDDDEFVELLNNSSNPVDVSNVVVADATNNRFTFPANTMLAAGRVVVIFGGGNPPSNDPAFGGALIFTTSSLSLNDTGDTVNVKLAVGGSDVVVATQTYGGSSGVAAPSDQALTRSPDADTGSTGGSFVAHHTATNAAGRTFSAGTRADGTPFGSPAVTRIEVLPTTARANIGAAQSFMAHAFNNSGGSEIEIQNVSFIWDSIDTSKATLAPTTGRTTTATALASGDTTIRARAGAQQGTSVLSVNPILSINDISQSEGNSGTTTFTFTVSLSNPAPTGGVTFDIATQDGAATLANNDYVARALTSQTIPGGSQTYSFAVTVNTDTTIEPNETFFVNVTNVSGATVADGQGQGTIVNDDSPALSIADVSQNEGDIGTTTFTFTVTSSLPAPASGITFDITTQDSTAVAPDDYTARSLTNQTIPAGQQTYNFDVTVNGDTLVELNETFLVKVTSANGNPQATGTIVNDDNANLVISQLYGGGNNSGAQFRNDFVEIFNRGTTTIDFSLTPYSIQNTGVGSNFGGTTATSKTNLTSGSIAPGKYFLVQESGGTTNGVPLPVADATGSINIGSTSGKVALVVGTTALASATCPADDAVSPLNASDATIVDFVGYGNNANTSGHCYEGTGPASAPSNTTAEFRKTGGCTDTNDNASDFFISTPSPRNSISPANNCAGGVAPNLSINDVTVMEENSGTVTATFTVILSAPAQGADVTFDIATADGSATTANNDYVAKSLTSQVIPAGQTTYSFSVNINGDNHVEPDETFAVNLSNVAGANVIDGVGVGTIQNDDLPALSVTDASLLEGDSGTRVFSFTVNLSTPAPGPVTFDIATQDGTATVADNDYVARSLTSRTIGTGLSSYTFDVTVNGDTRIEPNETFLVNVTNVSGATVTDNQGQGTIQNDDSPVLNINDVSMAEGNSGTTTFTFTVTSTLAAPAGGITFDIATADGTAQDHNPVSEDNDYVARSLSSQTIPAGQTTYTFDVTVNGDKLVEPGETFLVNVTNATNASIGDGVGQGTIQNDDTQNLVISQIYGGGNNSGATFQNDFVEIFNRGTTTVNFGITPYSVQYASQAGNFSSSAGNKLDLTSGSLIPGQYFLVQLAGGTTNGAGLPAANATGSIAMSATDGKVALVPGTAAAGTTAGGCPSGVTVADLIGYGGANCSETTATVALSATKAALRKTDGCTDTDNNSADFTTPTLSSGAPPRNSSSAINDCNAPPNLTINDVALTEGNGGTRLFTFTVTLSKPALAGGVTFDIATANDTAAAGSDYSANSANGVSIGAGSQTATFDVTVNGDTTVEADETFFVNVTNVTGATVVDGQGVGTIQNDDTPSLSINDVTHNEGNSSTTTYTFTVTLAPASNQTVTVNYATADGTATAGSDYTAIPSTQLTFLAGETTKTFDVIVSGDTTVEPDETFVVNLGGATNANVSDSQSVGTITNDDGATVVISQIYAGGGNAGAQYTNDFVELLNRTAMAIDVSNWSVQTATATGTTWTVARLCPVSQTCSIPAHGYYLIKMAAGATPSASLPQEDATGTTNFATTGGKATLVTNTTALTGSAAGTTPLGGATCPNTNTNSVLDFVGYGNATCFEGGTAAAAQTNTTADIRASSGCTDSNANSSNFSTAAPSPHNSSSSHTCP
ncbi:MAG TPA: Calx-beta domain-containing protein [Pyrinomonadaceae bacterium]